MTLSRNPYDQLTDSTALNKNVLVLDRSEEEKHESALSMKERRMMYKLKFGLVVGVLSGFIGFILGAIFV